jgi:hypothetical protein
MIKFFMSHYELFIETTTETPTKKKKSTKKL